MIKCLYCQGRGISKKAKINAKSNLHQIMKTNNMYEWVNECYVLKTLLTKIKSLSSAFNKWKSTFFNLIYYIRNFF